MAIQVKEEHREEFQELLDNVNAARDSMEHFSRIASKSHKRLWDRIYELYPETEVGKIHRLNSKTWEIVADAE